jgi:hypothetical protein
VLRYNTEMRREVAEPEAEIWQKAAFLQQYVFIHVAYSERVAVDGHGVVDVFGKGIDFQMHKT